MCQYSYTNLEFFKSCALRSVSGRPRLSIDRFVLAKLAGRKEKLTMKKRLNNETKIEAACFFSQIESVAVEMMDPLVAVVVMVCLLRVHRSLRLCRSSSSS